MFPSSMEVEKKDKFYKCGYFSTANMLLVGALEKRDFPVQKYNPSNDSLTISCEIIACKSMKNILGLKNDSKIHRMLSDDLSTLLESKELSDFTIQVGSKKFEVHKAILAARSPVFSAMFRQDMKEKNENVLEISDVDERIMQEVLRFIYTENVEKIEDLAIDLLAVAEKYSLDGLKIMCLKAICSKLTANNSLNMLELAKKYNADLLKKYTIQFYNAHGKDPSLYVETKSSIPVLTALVTALTCTCVEFYMAKKYFASPCLPLVRPEINVSLHPFISILSSIKLISPFFTTLPSSS